MTPRGGLGVYPSTLLRAGLGIYGKGNLNGKFRTPLGYFTIAQNPKLTKLLFQREPSLNAQFSEIATND